VRPQPGDSTDRIRAIDTPDGGAHRRLQRARSVPRPATLIVVVLLQGPIRDGFGVGLWLGTPLLFLVATGVWLWTQHLLLAARVPWLRLLLAAATTTALGLTARLYMPAALNRALSEYGSLGLVLSMLSWLIIVCAAVTFAVTIGAVLADGPPLNRYLHDG
jgi:membrane protein